MGTKSLTLKGRPENGLGGRLGGASVCSSAFQDGVNCTIHGQPRFNCSARA